MPQEKISMVVSANAGSSDGQKVAFRHISIGGMTLTNGGATSIQYSIDAGSSWSTVTAGSSVTPTIPDGTKFRLRKATSDGILIPVTLAFNGSNDAPSAGYTVATLPAAGEPGRRAYVTDATTPAYLGALTGGGAVKCPVFDNGTAWVVG